MEEIRKNKMATNKQIYDALKVIENKIPSNCECVDSINKSIKSISYEQRITITELRKIIALCGSRRFGCGNNK